MPYADGLIKKSDLTRAIDYQIVPLSINERVMEDIFGPSKSMDLKSYCVTILIYQIFKRNAKPNKYALSEENFMTALKEVTFSKAFLDRVDNMFIPTTEEMEDAAKRPEIVFDERDFLVTFLQTGY